jgi:hypothetical protein
VLISQMVHWPFVHVLLIEQLFLGI